MPAPRITSSLKRGNDVDNQVKQRVIGAVVLVALAVIFVPMLLEKPDSDLGPVGSNLPEQPDQAVHDRIEPLTLPEPPAEDEPAQVVIDQAPEGAALPSAGTQTGPETGVPATESPMPAVPAPTEEAAAPTVPPLPAPVTTPPPASTAAPAVPTTPPAVPPPAAAPAPAAPSTATPPPVTPAKPVPSAQPETAPKPLSGWVVQLASLASKDNAMALRERLRGHGYTAFVEEIKTPQGVLYRVRVGPELERANADNLRNRLEQQVQIKGIVTRYP